MQKLSRSMLAGIAVGLTFASTSSFAAAPLPVEQIIGRNVAARGGLQAWRKVNSVSMMGEMDANKPLASRPDYHPPGVNPKHSAPAGALPAATVDNANKVIELPYRLEMKRPLKTRLEIDVNGQTAVQVYDGARGAKIRPFLGRTAPEAFTAGELELAAAEPELDGPLIDHERKGTRVTLDGIEKVQGSEAYKLKLTFRNGTVRHLWLDATSFLEIKMDGTRRLDGKIHAVETYLRNYQAVNGLMFPMLTETVIEGVPGSTKLTVASVSVNPSLDDSRFSIAANAVATAAAMR
jgi:hypothetical protein